jgi:ketosteroid isomerase-like protein
MTPSEKVRAYYASYKNPDREITDAFMDPACVVDEPTFLPYGQVEIIGPKEMHRLVGSVFLKLFADSKLTDTRCFEEGDDVIASSVWHMTGKFTGKRIPCHYHEYFEFNKDGKISAIRTLYGAAKEMLEEMAAAEAAGVDLTPGNF